MDLAEPLMLYLLHNQPLVAALKIREDELGTVLLIREVDGVKLTDDGAILYEHAKADPRSI